MKAVPFGPPHRRSNRDDASATSGFDASLKRATTVCPDRFVKLTKNRPLRGGIGRERHAEQALLAAADDRAAEIEEVRGEQRAILRNPDVAVLLDDEPHAGTCRILNGGDRRPKTRHLDSRTQLPVKVRRGRQDRQCYTENPPHLHAGMLIRCALFERR